MQTNSVIPGKLSAWVTCTAHAFAFLILLSGCNPAPAPVVPTNSRQEFAGARIAFGGRDESTTREFLRRAGTWMKRTGATVEFSTDPDVVLLEPGELGTAIARDDLRPVPDDMRNSAHTLQWSRCLTVWSERLSGWGGLIYGLPLAGESYVLAYRTDLLEQAATKWKVAIPPPSTWEDYAELAEGFAMGGGPALPKPPRDPSQALREFTFAAACFDRPALTGSEFTSRLRSDKERSQAAEMLAFHHELTTGEPRLMKPAFRAAAELWKRTARCRSAAMSDDPMAELAAGRAVMAIVSLVELGRASKTDGAIDRRIGIAPLPGTRIWFDADGKPQPPADKVRGVNFVPVFGLGGWIGVVRNRCQNPEAAFEFLAELSSLDRSTELLSDPALGFGPFRVEHLDSSRETIWQRYGFDAERSRQLAAAVRFQTAAGLAVPTVGLRGPDRTELLRLLSAELDKLGSGSTTAEQALSAADAAWRKADAARPKDSLLTERRKAAGLN
jgi:ABC-type glycerol-3-phosphate transport system substrate-binding protein